MRDSCTYSQSVLSPLPGERDTERWGGIAREKDRERERDSNT